MSAPNLTLLIGGVRSGKSALAERLAHATGKPVLFVATMQPLDDELRTRVAAHQASRPRSWRTIEEPERVVSALGQHAGPGDTVVIDCLTLWIANLLQRDLPDPDSAPVEAVGDAIAAARTSAADFSRWAASHDGEVIAVTNEVGMGVVPAYSIGRAFRDALGAANGVVAASAGRVYHLTAGLALELKAQGARPVDAFGEAPLNDPDL
jgi:adenosyl cobinamide kinase/adenosyl cobinamide phosphate guanylyltransferase